MSKLFDDEGNPIPDVEDNADNEDEVDTSSDDEATGKILSAVSIKLPPFWPHRPSLWFARAEGQFRLRGIKAELTKFDHVLNSLPDEVLATVEQAVENPSPNSAYTDLKDALMERHAPHNVTRFMQLVESEPISPGMDPMKVKDQVAALKLKSVEHELGMFLAKMPDAIKHDLLMNADSFRSLSVCATAAKRLMGKTGHSAVVSAVQHRGSTRRNPLFQPRAKQGQGQSKGLCAGHARWGERSFSCRQPCSWSGSRQFIRSVEEQGNDIYPC